MDTVFFVFGYGIPKNILKDENYRVYLGVMMNTVYACSVEKKIKNPFIIFCGGPTDCVKPYKRKEADEMIKLFRTMIRQRPFLKQITKDWVLIPERESLSTLENLLNSKKIISLRHITKAHPTIFCEYTRGARIQQLARKIFNKDDEVEIIPIDFDMSANRYLPREFLAKKEKAELAYSLWALQSLANLAKHHAVFEEKLAYFRNAGPKAQGDAIRIWWQWKLEELQKT